MGGGAADGYTSAHFVVKNVSGARRLQERISIKTEGSADIISNRGNKKGADTMSGKLINTLKYGSSRTKRKIYFMFGVLAIGVAFTVAALMLENELLGLAAFLVIFIDGLILFNTSFEQKTISVKTKEKKEKEEKEEKEEDEGPGALEWISSEKKEKKKKKDASGEETEEEDTEEEEEAEEKPGRQSIEEPEEQNPLLQYDDKKLKKIMVAYKVKKHHVTVLIDNCRAEHIVESPAYMWKDSSYLYFLVLADEPRMIKSSLAESSVIHIRRGAPARPMEEYADLNVPSPVSLVFGGLLPKYYKVESSPYRMEYKKNLYSAAPGIWCTPASVKQMLKLLPANFVLDDSKVEYESEYYQNIYIARIMYWDGVYSGQEYKEKVLEVLSGLAKAELSEGTVKGYLSAMMQKGLIPREYADYVLSKKKKKK